MIRYFLSLAICLVVLPFQYPVVALLLLTKWDGRTTMFGNKLYGRGNSHYAHPTKGYWQEFVWLTYRNPINNLLADFAVVCRPSLLRGNPRIGDKAEGGIYRVDMGNAWELYWIKPYSKRRCIRVRLGWKIYGKTSGEMCPMVFVINPLMPYLGA